jgi:hypothetical protein
MAAHELARFSRFLGEAHVVDTGMSFENFAMNPVAIVRESILK